MARIQETIQFSDNILPNTPYIVALDLTLFNRAGVASLIYQEYRMTNFQLKWTPNYDTYQQGQVLAAVGDISISAPQLWGMVDRQGMANYTRFTEATFEAFGIKPVKWTKDVVRNVVPNILLTQGAETAGDPGTSLPTPSPNPGMIKKSPWLSTQNESSAAQPTRFNGYVFYVQQDVIPSVAFSLGDLYITCDFEYRKPAIPYMLPDPEAAPAVDVLKTMKKTNIISKLKNISLSSPLQEEKK
jgi:hypothetical protein